MKGADLRRLNFTSDDIRVAGIVTSDLTGQNINDVNGNIDVRNVVIIKNRKRYAIDSLLYASINNEGQTHISFESTIFAGTIRRHNSAERFAGSVEGTLSRYFTLQGVQRGNDLNAQAFTFRIALRDPTILTDVFFPELHRLSAGTIEGNYNSNNKDLNVNIDIPRVDYNDLKIDNLSLRVTSDADLLQARLTVGSIADSTVLVTNLQLAGKAAHDSIDVALQSTRR